MPATNPTRLSANASGQGKRNRKALKGAPAAATLTQAESEPSPSPQPTTSTSAETAEDIPTCWICAEPVKFWGLSQCNHRTCHVCALRLRALYKRMDCTFCKEDQPVIILTLDSEKTFSSYTPDEIPFKDPKLSISFETQEMMEETLILLRFNCPDTSCDFIAGGWNDLKMHVRAVHGRQMCDLCIKFKKVFAHEHSLYTHAQLGVHLPSYNRRPGAPPHSKAKDAKEKVEGGVHPFCEFCKEAYFGGDELFAHMRETHEECFICKRNDIREQYFLNYPNLERHFNEVHHPCPNAECQAQKFVVFASKLDLQGHMIEVHQQAMSSRDKKEARRIVEGIEFEQTPRPPTNRNNRANGAAVQSSGQPSRGSRRDNFGAQLTTPASFPALPSNRQERASPPKEPDSTPLFELRNSDSVTTERHQALISRIGALTPQSSSAVTSIRLGIRSYLASESGARDLISTVFTLVKQDLEATASIMNGLVDILEDEEKSKSLLSAWNGFKVEHRRDFPELTPSGVGTSYSGISSGRVLNAKQSTIPRTSQQSTRNMLDRVANAAANTSRAVDSFPVLPSSSSKPKTQVRGSAPTPWSPASTSKKQQTPVLQPFSVPGSGGQGKGRPAPPKLSNSLFPSLPPPSSTTALEARQLVSGDRMKKSNSSIWGSGPASGSAPATPGESENESADAQMTRGKKKKGKEKQMLFTLGTFPT